MIEEFTRGRSTSLATTRGNAAARAVLGTTVVCGALLAPAHSWASVGIVTQAEYIFQDSNNVFDLSEGIAPAGQTSTARSDAYSSYGGNINTNFAWSRQTLTLNLQGADVHYQRFKDLDHSEYRLGADLHWKSLDILDGDLAINRSRQMVAFYDFTGTQFSGTQLSQQTNQNEHASLNVQVTRSWQLQGAANISDSESPRPGQPDLRLREQSATAALNYMGFAGLTAGIGGTYTHGDYTGTVLANEPSYHQTTAQLDVNYSTNPSSHFEAAAGYTQRSSALGFDKFGGLTGLLAYTRSLTVKTNFKLQLSRAVTSYITNAGSEVDTEASGTLNWQALHKLALSATYRYMISDLPHQGLFFSDRRDHFRTAAINADYSLKWLEIKPYIQWETRSSDAPGVPYSANIIGVSFYLRWENGGVLH